MKNQITKLLVVDDEPLNITIMHEYLDEVYANIECATNGLECLEKLKTYKPDILLLDVSMPGMDGYQVCETIKSNASLADITVIFVSARGTPEERLSGFKAGGEDYIVKPYKEEELLLKIAKTIDYHDKLTILNNELDDAQSVAFEAMTTSSEMGFVAQYLEQLFELDNADAIMQATINFAKIFDLAICQRVKLCDEYLFSSHQTCISPLEKEVIELLENSGRIYKFDNRIQFNFSHINVLVKNMPIKDINRYGRLTDIIPIALSGANNALKTLFYKQTAQDKQKVESLVANIHTMTHDVVNNIDTVKAQVNTALELLHDTLEKNIPFMGLEDDQEALITNTTDNVISSVNKTLTSLENINVQMNQIKSESESEKFAK